MAINFEERVPAGPIRDVGQCIYCGAKGPGVVLSKEHVIPFSFGSNSYLRNASCQSCSAITRDFETHVARNIFGHLRIHWGVRTRNREERPSELPLTVSADGSTSTVQLPVQQHPYFLVLPVWDIPGLMCGRQPSKGFPGLVYNSYHHIPHNIRDVLKLRNHNSKIGPDNKSIDPERFARALAKIAYCAAIGAYGLGAFRPLAIRDLILGKYTGVSYFVGASTRPFTIPPPPEPEFALQHKIVIESGLLHGKIPLLSAVIRLFPDAGDGVHGMPVYRVIVGVAGERLREFAAPLRSSSTHNR